MRSCYLLLVAFVLSLANAQHLPLPELPYEYSALQPVLSEALMRLHHLKHHQTYTDNVNRALQQLRDTGHEDVVQKGIDYIIKHLDLLDEPLRTAIQNNGGGYVNHAFFWKILRPQQTNPEPDTASHLHAAILRDFHSFQSFKETFSRSALSVFGSGWTWLIFNPLSGKLVIYNTPNQDSPTSKNLIPLLNIDVWEHAYYVDYENRRAEWVNNWWTLINWPVVEKLYENARNQFHHRKTDL